MLMLWYAVLFGAVAYAALLVRSIRGGRGWREPLPTVLYLLLAVVVLFFCAAAWDIEQAEQLRWGERGRWLGPPARR